MEPSRNRVVFLLLQCRTQKEALRNAANPRVSECFPKGLPAPSAGKPGSLDLQSNASQLSYFASKLFEIKMAEFKISIKCMWYSESGDFEKLTDGDSDEIKKEETDEDSGRRRK
ncbi:hypothetical protein G5714_011597 [Onychostoma macrolepis]|uniref:Uncharacterized protein n=1 Tax=Onychostoma macrolepis TaxID=369639 RepID=A0A7J6CL56_9TELE|nr:hypothetical protein G5714_011597 [Onychostoma macrolepis]